MSVLALVRDRLVEDGSVRTRRIAARGALAAALTEAGAELDAHRPEVVVGGDDALLGRAQIGAVLRAPATGTLAVPALLVEDRYGSGQAELAAVMDATNLLIAGKRTVVVGYGAAGRSIARHARGLNAEIVVCEDDPVAALDAFQDGFDLLPLDEAASVADLLLAGGRELPPSVVARLRDGALVAGAPTLRAGAPETHRVREHVEALQLDRDRSVFLITLAPSQPAELEDLTLAAEALAVRHLLLHGDELGPGLQPLPRVLAEEVAARKLAALGLRI